MCTFTFGKNLKIQPPAPLYFKKSTFSIVGFLIFGADRPPPLRLSPLFWTFFLIPLDYPRHIQQKQTINNIRYGQHCPINIYEPNSALNKFVFHFDLRGNYGLAFLIRTAVSRFVRKMEAKRLGPSVLELQQKQKLKKSSKMKMKI